MAVSFIDSLKLNPEQREAVLFDEGSQLVFAGAGTGKTKVLTSKIAWLIRERGILPTQIFAATFTNKAAGEMKERISKLIHSSCDGLWIGTFHSLCVKILRREAEKIGYSPWFTIYDTSEQLALMKNVFKASDVDENTLQPKTVLHSISSYKNKSITPDILEKNAQSFYDRELVSIYRAYQSALKKADAMDFDDLILNVVHLFSESPETARDYEGRFHYILVDEYQDTNGTQFQLVKFLAGEVNPVFAVGDDDQSIYGWRGAQIENILNFENCFGRTKVFKLEHNYRSTKPILAFANAVITQNANRAGKSLWTESEGVDEVRVCGYSDDRMEAKKIVGEIRRALDVGEIQSENIAILFRTNAQSRLFEESLRRENVPYVLVGGTSFYDRKEIKDILAYLKLLVNPRDDVSCQRVLNVPARGIGAVSQDKIAQEARIRNKGFFEVIASGEAESVLSGKARVGVSAFRTLFFNVRDLQKKGVSVDSIMTELIAGSGYMTELADGSEEARSRIENINELINAITEWQENHPDSGVREFLEEITLASDLDTYDGSSAVSLMTLHTAKGLEFERVYLVGLEDGLIPSRQNFDDRAKMEEECRLLYVGITRAEKQLICSYAESRMRFGAIMPMGPSRFINSVPENLYRMVDESARYRTASWEDEWQAPVQRGGATSTTVASRVRRFGGNAVAKEPEPKRQIPTYDDFNQSTEVLFRVGQKVQQATYGIGKIMSLSGFGPDLRVTVLFENGVRKQLVAKFAKLSPI